MTPLEDPVAPSNMLNMNNSSRSEGQLKKKINISVKPAIRSNNNINQQPDLRNPRSDNDKLIKP